MRSCGPRLLLLTLYMTVAQFAHGLMFVILNDVVRITKSYKQYFHEMTDFKQHKKTLSNNVLTGYISKFQYMVNITTIIPIKNNDLKLLNYIQDTQHPLVTYGMTLDKSTLVMDNKPIKIYAFKNN